MAAGEVRIVIERCPSCPSALNPTDLYCRCAMHCHTLREVVLECFGTHDELGPPVVAGACLA